MLRERSTAPTALLCCNKLYANAAMARNHGPAMHECPVCLLSMLPNVQLRQRSYGVRHQRAVIHTNLQLNH